MTGQYMLDPKIATLVSREMEDRSIVVFDEAHNIDNVCIEALSVSLDSRLLNASIGNLVSLSRKVQEYVLRLHPLVRPVATHTWCHRWAHPEFNFVNGNIVMTHPTTPTTTDL